MARLVEVGVAARPLHVQLVIIRDDSRIDATRRPGQGANQRARTCAALLSRSTRPVRCRPGTDRIDDDRGPASEHDHIGKPGPATVWLVWDARRAGIGSMAGPRSTEPQGPSNQ